MSAKANLAIRVSALCAGRTARQVSLIQVRGHDADESEGHSFILLTRIEQVPIA